MTFQSTKTYGHNIGLTACFRQWRTDSHCHFLHGYALGIKLTFESEALDDRNWCVDFGSLRTFKAWLEKQFDHKTLVASDDPQIEYLREGHRLGVLDMVEVPATGCEKFAELVFCAANDWLKSNGYTPRVRLVSVEVMEHGANSAIYLGDSNASGK